MASIYGEYSKYTRLRIDYTISQSIENNTSTINMNMYAERTKASHQWVNSGSYYNMTNKANTAFSYDWASDSYELHIGSSSVTVNHNDDGTGSTTLSGYWNTYRTGSSYIPTELSVSATISLPTIARKSVVTLNKSSVTLGTSAAPDRTVTINTNRASESFTHALYWQINNGSWNTIATGVGSNKEWELPTTIANNMPNTSQNTINIICETYKGSTYIGKSTVSLTVNISSSAKPSISTFRVSGGINGVYVETLSNVSVSLAASGIYGSTITSYKVEMLKNGTKLKEASGSSATFTLNNLNITADTNIELKATVTDSRNNTQTQSKTITVKHYTKPAITSRNAYRCTSNGTVNNSGTYLYIYWAYSTTGISGLTTDTATVKYRQKGTSTWTTAEVANAGSAIVGAGAISTNYQYEVQYSISDGINPTATTFTDTIPTGYTTVDYKAGGKGVAFGKVSEKDEFECNMVADFLQDLKIKGKSLGIATYDNGLIDPNTTTEPLILSKHDNVPIAGTFFYIKTVFYSSKTTSRAQMAVQYNGIPRCFVRYNYAGSWNSWREIGVAFKQSTTASTAGWYNIATFSGTGHYPNSAVILNVSTSYNYNAPCSVLVSIITTYKDARITQLTAIDSNADPMITQIRVRYDDSTALFAVDAYYTGTQMNDLIVRNESIINKEIVIRTPRLVSGTYTVVDSLKIDYMGSNLRPRIMFTAAPSSRLAITGASWTTQKVALGSTKSNTSSGYLTASNGGIRIGKGISTVKISASLAYYQYATTGEVDLQILKNSTVVAGINGSCTVANYICSLTTNPIAINVVEGDIIYLAVCKGSANSMTILNDHAGTSLTVEVIG